MDPVCLVGRVLVVRIYSGDVAFESDGCGTWTRLPDPPAPPAPLPLPIPPEFVGPAIAAGVGSALVGSMVMPYAMPMLAFGSMELAAGSSDGTASSGSVEAAPGVDGGFAQFVNMPTP
ncbi:hypothetical protein P9209_09690 [Prescottella defluvii]|nr:hypothetical protein P9209_09690 [Prescottella defluvii]